MNPLDMATRDGACYALLLGMSCGIDHPLIAAGFVLSGFAAYLACVLASD